MGPRIVLKVTGVTWSNHEGSIKGFVAGDVPLLSIEDTEDKIEASRMMGTDESV